MVRDDPPHDPQTSILNARDQHWITTRSVCIGIAGVSLIAALAPYNDMVVSNTFLIGSYLPVGALLATFLTVLFNALLHRCVPRRALSSGELAVILAMLLVACAVPTQGLMRSFLPQLVAPFYYGGQDPAFWKVFSSMHLPRWLYPENERGGWLAQAFYHSLPSESPIPFRAWVIPLLMWGVFVFALYATLLSLGSILWKQWSLNERLAFPIAQVEAALIEAPPHGRAFNTLFRSRLFWIGAGAVFLVHSLVAMHRYYPKYVPEIPLGYNFANLFTAEPWVYFTRVKSATIYFTFIGIAYFIQSRVGFSLWGCFLIGQLIEVVLRANFSIEVFNAGALHGAPIDDQFVGGSITFVAGVLWVGRQQWVLVARQFVRGAYKGEDGGTFLSYRSAALIAIVGIAVMFGWLLLLGVKFWVACGIVGFILLGHVLISRVVAETGLPFIRSYARFPLIMTNLPADWVSARDVYFSALFTVFGPYTTREGAQVFAMHGMQVAGSMDPPPGRKSRVGLVGLMAISLVLSYFVSAGSGLYCYYRYATPITPKAPPILNDVGMERWTTQDVNQPLLRWSAAQSQTPPRWPTKPYPSWSNMIAGALVTGGLYFATLRWSWWPILPIGYLFCFTWYINEAWLSLFIGWTVKVILLKFGGPKLYQSARPLFVGLVLGEALAAGAWLVINLLLASGGFSYEKLEMLPHVIWHVATSFAR